MALDRVMNFREFFEEEEELDLLAEAIIEEGLVGSALRAVGGFGGNLISQTARGAGNLAVGAGKAARGVGRVGLGAVQGLTGGVRQGLSNIGGGIGDIASGVGSAATGAAQAAGALSGVTPTIRAVQAAGENSFFTPMSNRRTAVQRAMGLNSWDPEGDAAKDSSERFSQLKAAYVKAHKSGDRMAKRRIRAEMEKADPKAYRQLVAKSQVAKRAKTRDAWSHLDSVSPPQSPEDFLGSISAAE